MFREHRSKKKKLKILLIVLLSLLLAAGLSLLAFFYVFTVKNVTVKGNEIYQSEAIERFVLDDEYSWSTLYVFFKYRFRKTGQLPFVDSVSVSIKSPHSLEIKVTEKAMLGYVYLRNLGQNAYFDKEGFVVETSSQVIAGVPQVTGLDMDQVVLYEKLPIKGSNVLKNLLLLTQMLKKYEMLPDNIVFAADFSCSLEYGDIKVLLGTSDKLTEKIQRLSYILPKLEGKSGTLHLESWSENTTDISFEQTKE
ncbi:hypothetical protein FACS1894111_01670 [Clostridia bacterium]|nr:hypothetical protein FACS1894111_01670 [Clostridia bacterium]